MCVCVCICVCVCVCVRTRVSVGVNSINNIRVLIFAPPGSNPRHPFAYNRKRYFCITIERE